MFIAFIILAALFNAVMDSVENEHFFDTVFRDKDKSFWYKRESWNKATQFGGYKFDAWHLAKSAMIFCFVLAILLYRSWFGWWDFVIIGVIWNISFNLFYRLLKK